jgi:hypothetical protein
MRVKGESPVPPASTPFGFSANLSSDTTTFAFRALDRHLTLMCGRVIQSSGPLRYGIVEGLDVHDSRVHNYPPRWNAAPSQELLVIRRNHQTGEVSLGPLRWGLIPYWCQDPKGGRKPINAKCETVDRLPMFREAYRRRRCILPVDGFPGRAGTNPWRVSWPRRSRRRIARTGAFRRSAPRWSGRTIRRRASRRRRHNC